MDKDFEAIIAKMRRRRQVEALIMGTAIFLAGCAVGFAFAMSVVAG